MLCYKGGGFVVPVNDVAAIKEKILFFYSQPENVALYGKAAWSVAQHYTWNNYHEQLNKTMHDIWERTQLKTAANTDV